MTEGWTIAWCQEDCFKESGIELRKILCLHAKNMGVKLRPFKRVTDFVQWSAQEPHPCVLFTSWRATKPCISAITSPSFQNKVMLTTVLCMDMVQQNRARHWFASLMKRTGKHIPVEVTTHDLLKQELQVCGDPVNNTSDLAISAHMLFQSPPSTQREAMCSPKAQEETMRANDLRQQTHLLEDAVEARCASWRVWPKKSGVQMMRMTSNPAEGSAISVPQGGWPIVTHGLADPSISQVWTDPVVADIWIRLQCPKKVQHALMACTPDTYED